MPKNLNVLTEELKKNLEKKGYKKEIPLNVVRSEFMILTGYGKNKVIEWVDNLEFCNLITVKDDKVNFHTK